ncbi:DUF6048 family protein [Lacinutrix jangbogonensis]|uniref:DUF6048 family protein n=1 Tax=Lacinutrix jangbogonensis TaxID=1469557 RepID=UPI001F14FD66|nr:DUF6048 family protein [Lacinutrix jangbogonensis]
MKYTLQYVTSGFFLLCCMLIGAQEEKEIKAVDSIKYIQEYGLRLGTDFGKLIRTFADDEYTGFEVNGDFRITKKLYIAGEFGTEKKTTSTDFINTTANGSYVKIGIDYNMYTNWLGMNNMIYSGFRTGFSTFSQTLDSYTVYSQDQFWQPQFTNTESEEFDGLSSTWLEFILGIKAEVFNNLYIGINAQLKRTLSEKSPDNLENHYIPGFNKTYDSKKFGVGYGYTISYLIPLFKKDK